MDKNTSKPPNSSSSEVVERIWRDLPYLPRAIAQIAYFTETDERIHSLVTKNETELAALVLADTFPVRSAFTDTYGLPWRAARHLFTMAIEHMVNHPSAEDGDRVIYGICAQMLYRLGYMDGLAGAYMTSVEPNENAELRPPPPTSDEEKRMWDAVREINDQVFQPAYWSGFHYGAAEAYLSNYHPDLLEAIDARGVVLIETNSGSADDIGGELADIVREREADLTVNDVEKALLYAEGRSLQIRRIRAHRAVQRYLAEELPISPIAIASVIRVLSQEVQRQNGANRTTREDELEEALLIAATLGFVPQTINKLLAPALEDTVVNIVARSHRDYQWADLARRVANGLNDRTPAGRFWPPRRTHVPGRGAKPRTLQLSSFEAVRALVQTIQSGLRSSEVIEDAKAYRARLHRMRTPPADAGELLAYYLLPRCDFELEASAATFVRAEIIASQEPDANLWSLLNWRLMRRVAAEAGMSLLKAWDQAGACRGAAEAELARAGRFHEAEMAEGWVRTYRAEGAELGADKAMLSWYLEIPRGSQAAEGVLLLARARLIENALDERAWREAQFEVARHVPGIGQNIYAAENAEAVIRDVFRVVASQALNVAERKLARWPSFKARVTALVPVAAEEALVTELGVVEEIRAARKGDA